MQGWPMTPPLLHKEPHTNPGTRTAAIKTGNRLKMGEIGTLVTVGAILTGVVKQGFDYLETHTGERLEAVERKATESAKEISEVRSEVKDIKADVRSQREETRGLYNAVLYGRRNRDLEKPVPDDSDGGSK